MRADIEMHFGRGEIEHLSDKLDFFQEAKYNELFAVICYRPEHLKVDFKYRLKKRQLSLDELNQVLHAINSFSARRTRFIIENRNKSDLASQPPRYFGFIWMPRILG